MGPPPQSGQVSTSIGPVADHPSPTAKRFGGPSLRRVAGAAIFGVGVAGIASGALFGLEAKSKMNDSDSSGHCRSRRVSCDRGRRSAHSRRGVGDGHEHARQTVRVWLTADRRGRSAGKRLASDRLARSARCPKELSGLLFELVGHPAGRGHVTTARQRREGSVRANSLPLVNQIELSVRLLGKWSKSHRSV